MNLNTVLQVIQNFETKHGRVPGKVLVSPTSLPKLVVEANLSIPEKHGFFLFGTFINVDNSLNDDQAVPKHCAQSKGVEQNQIV